MFEHCLNLWKHLSTRLTKIGILFILVLGGDTSPYSGLNLVKKTLWPTFSSNRWSSVRDITFLQDPITRLQHESAYHCAHIKNFEVMCAFFTVITFAMFSPLFMTKVLAGRDWHKNSSLWSLFISLWYIKPPISVSFGWLDEQNYRI